MSTVSRRPSREEIKKVRREKKKAEGLVVPNKPSMPNCKCRYKSVAEERQARQDAVSEQIRVIRAKLPVLLPRLSRIKDPRNPKKIKHNHTLLMIYGILIFVLQMASRREANREMTRPVFMENLKLLFPELEDLPHNDTLYRLLASIDVKEIESALVELVRKMIRNKKFVRYLVGNRYPIAIDGTQKCVRDVLWSQECLEREVGKGDDTQMQYYVYVLEASLAFAGGMTIPLMSEFSSYTEGDTDTKRQDCEQKAFSRLARRLKDAFGHLPIMVLLDGLYPKTAQSWNCAAWGSRRQRFEWVNGIEYFYGPNGRKKQIVHLVVCEESWEEIARDSAEVVTNKSRHAWISSKPLCRQNLHERCNLGARYRWGIESGILVEKRHGYHYEHIFSYNWNAMKGYHYLMRLGHLINILAIYSDRLVKMVRELGVRGFIRFVRETISGPWLEPLWVRQRLAAPFQLRLI